MTDQKTLANGENLADSSHRMPAAREQDVRLKALDALELAEEHILPVAFALWFFRDPFRSVPEGLPDGAMISPADGRVSAVVTVIVSCCAAVWPSPLTTP